MLVRMRLVDVVVPRAQAAVAVRRLHLAGAVHLVPFRLPAGDETGVFGTCPSTTAPSAEPWRRWFDWLSELVASLGASDVPAALVAELWELDDHTLGARIAPLEAVNARATALANEREALAADRARLDWYGQLLDGLVGTGGALTIPPGYASVAIVVEQGHGHVIDLVEDELRELAAGRCAVVRTPLRRSRAGGILVFPGRLAGEVDAMLGGRRLDELTLPPQLAGVPLAAAASRLEIERARLDERIERAEVDLAELRGSHGALAAAARLVVGDRLAEAETFRAAGASEHLVVFSGWVPANRVAGLRAALGPGSAVTERRPTPEELARAPVALENRRTIRPFEPLASFVGVPRYGSLDPTPLLALVFPLFVGLMVGDAGYGLLLLVLLLAARRRWRASALVAAVWPVAAIAATSTIVFGVLFGEWFGDLGRAFGAAPIWLDRRDAVRQLLLLTVAVGVAHVALGLALGAANGLRMGNRREVASRSAQLVCLAGIVGILGALAGFLPAVAGQLAGAVLAIGLLALVGVLGFIAPVELLGIVGNVLSYARLMAIGLSSAMLATVANTLGALAGNLVLGVLVAGALHGLNFALGFFDATVQGLRLHYVEFFSKFVEVGQVRYAPFVSALGPDRREARRGD